jgi:hypothetical protein
MRSLLGPFELKISILTTWYGNRVFPPFWPLDESLNWLFDHTECAADPGDRIQSTNHSEPCRERDRRDEGALGENRIISIRTSRSRTLPSSCLTQLGIPEQIEEVSTVFTGKAEGMGMDCPSRIPVSRRTMG